VIVSLCVLLVLLNIWIKTHLTKKVRQATLNVETEFEPSTCSHCQLDITVTYVSYFSFSVTKTPVLNNI